MFPIRKMCQPYECDHMETYERTLTGNNGYTADDANHTPASYVIVQTVCANDICGEVIEEKGTYTPLRTRCPNRMPLRMACAPYAGMRARTPI